MSAQAEKNKAIVRRFLEELAKGNLDVIDELVAPDFVDRSLMTGQGPTREDFKRSVAEILDAFSIMNFTIEEQVAEGDTVVTKYTERSVIRGEFAGLPPTGTEESFQGIYIHRISDSKIIEEWSQANILYTTLERLTADLQRSRERLVATREEERRRLRRDLHDGLGPTLASFALKLDAARKLVKPEPEEAEELLSRLKDQTQDTVGDVRRLVHGLRPPALDDLGLVAAVRQQAESHGFVVNGFSGGSDKEAGREGGLVVFSMEAPEVLPSLPAAVEVAAYRIAQEALTNVARHARAKTCRVRLSVDQGAGVLEVEITDDGVGMPKNRVAGVGLSSMRERVEELGGTLGVEPGSYGGTHVLARLPLPAGEERLEGGRSSWRAPSESS